MKILVWHVFAFLFVMFVASFFIPDWLTVGITCGALILACILACIFTDQKPKQ